ncbi:hypothetical protein AB0H03_00670 [Streptomyces sparsogenes]|uniref:hypothetical protein n=1 Tax=Streptomyces sparsogenes TaxID=67365 RepID=UPI0033D1A00B
MNPVDPLAVDRFVEAGYQPFADALGDFFGSPVAYMFFDQPHAVYYDWAERTGDLRAAMPFHESLAGLDPGALARADLRARPLRRGRLPRPHRGGRAGRPGAAQPVFGDSVARHHGRAGTMVEQYFLTPPEGGTPWSGHWGLSLEELRTTAINHHGFYQTHGHGDDHESLRNPRFDFPPGINFEPWFADHHLPFALESARLSEFLDPVSPQCGVAVLYPLRTVWTAGQLGEQASALGEWARALTEARVGFPLVDERDLEAAAVEEGAVCFGDRRYRALVLPAVTTLRSAASLRRLRRLAESGVRVLAGGATPAVYQEGPQNAAADWAALAPTVEVFGAVPAETVLRGLVARRERTEPTLRVPAGSAVRRRGGPDGADGFRFACFA